MQYDIIYTCVGLYKLYNVLVCLQIRAKLDELTKTLKGKKVTIVELKQELTKPQDSNEGTKMVKSTMRCLKGCGSFMMGKAGVTVLDCLRCDIKGCSKCWQVVESDPAAHA